MRINKIAIYFTDIFSILLILYFIYGIKQRGNIDSALFNSYRAAYKILLSHDPSYWRSEITKKTDIDLTLSGHTHGMQMGIYTKTMKWSPAKWLYPEYLGLYKENGKYLYVNPGIGYLLLPARLGIRPEITVITLKTK